MNLNLVVANKALPGAPLVSGAGAAGADGASGASGGSGASGAGGGAGASGAGGGAGASGAGWSWSSGAGGGAGASGAGGQPVFFGGSVSKQKTYLVKIRCQKQTRRPKVQAKDQAFICI